MRTTFSRLSLIVLAVAVSVLAAAPAQASTAPASWEKAPESSLLEILAIYVGGPLLLIAFLWVFALVTSRNHYVPPEPSNEIVPATRADVAHR